MSWKKKTLFSAILLFAVLGLFETFLWAIGVRTLLDQTDPYVGFTSQVPLFVEHTDGGSTIVETSPSKLRFFNHQRFPKSKPADSFRIFCLGGSTTYGRPYDDVTSFSGWLREFLPAASSRRNWEVINAGGISYASHRVLHVMRETVKYQPDLFVVYTGHNEFLEERTYRDIIQTPSLLREIGGLLARTRTYSALHGILKSPDRTGSHHATPVSDEVVTRLDNGIGPDAYSRDEQLAERINESFEHNLRQMIVLARSAGVDIVFITPASNLADCSPFKSEFGATFSSRDEWEQAMQNARLSLESGDPQAALSDIEHAIRLAPDHAETQFLYGQVLMKLGRYDEAKRALISARDNDICPLRATSTILRTLRQVCKSENAPLIDFEATVESLSPHRIPGASLFLDHVHPTIRGHRRLALDIFDWMVHQGITTKPAEWSQIVETVTQRVEGQIDQTAHGAALRNLAKVLTWAGKKEEANRLAIQAAELTENDAETVYLAGNALLKQGELDKAILKFQRAIEQDPNHVLALNSLGTALMQKRDFEGAQRSFQRALQLKPDFAPVHSNLGSLYQRTGNIDQALSHYRSAIRVNSRYSKGYNNIGALLRQQEKYDEAIEYLRKAIAINPNFAEAHYNLAASLERLNRLAEAESEYRRAIQINRGFRPAIVGLGTVLERQKRWSEAARVYREASRPPNPSLEASYRLAWLMATCPDPKLRNGRLALQIATQCAKATNYRHPEVLSTLAAANAELGDFAEAIKWQSQALSLANSGDREKHQTRLNVLRQSRPLRSS